MWLFCGLHTWHVGRIAFSCCCGLGCAYGVSRTKKCIFKGCGRISGNFRSSGPRKIFIFWCSDWPQIVKSFHSIARNFEIYAAHRRSLLQQAPTAEDASRAAEHVESSDTMRSSKAQRQAPPDNPETGDTTVEKEAALARK